MLAYFHNFDSFPVLTGSAPPSSQLKNLKTTPGIPSEGPNYKNGVPHATGELQNLLACVQNCSASTNGNIENEPLPKRKARSGIPHGKGEAAGSQSQQGEEERTAMRSQLCRNPFWTSAHTIGSGVLPHVHIQTVPGTRGGGGDLPEPED